MKELRFIYKDINNNLCVVRIMEEHINRLKNQGFSNEQIKQGVIDKDILPYCPSKIYYECNRDTLPNDRYFRNAWDHDVDGKPTIHRQKAEDIHMAKLRELREPILNQLDKDFMKALERNDTSRQKTIASMKQKLRDMPQTEDLSKLSSLDELKNYIPDYLK